MSNSHTGIQVGRQNANCPIYDETQSLEELYSPTLMNPKLKELELAVIGSSRVEHKVPIDRRLLPFVLLLQVPLLDPYSFPGEPDGDIKRVFEESEFCTRSQAINGFSFTFNNNIEQCSD